MQIDYQCADCDTSFPIKISDREVRTTISGTRKDACPCCRQRVGYGTVKCCRCDEPFVARMPLRHSQDKLAFGRCPQCLHIHLQPSEKKKAFT